MLFARKEFLCYDVNMSGKGSGAAAKILLPKAILDEFLHVTENGVNSNRKERRMIAKKESSTIDRTIREGKRQKI